MRAVRSVLVGAVCLAALGTGASVAVAGSPAKTKPKATVVKGAGDINDAVEKYRRILGPDNGTTPETHTSGRLWAGEVLCAEAEGLFISVGAERFTALKARREELQTRHAEGAPQ